MSDSPTNNQVQDEERLADRYARFAIRHRRVFMLTILVLTLVLSWFVKDLDIRNDPDTLLPPSNRYVATNAYTEQNFGMGNLMVFVNTMHPRETHAVTMDIQDYVEAHKGDPGFRQVHFGLRCKDTSCDVGAMAEAGEDYVRPGVGGFLGATEATREVAVDNWLAGPMLTAAAVFVIAALIFRSLLVSGILMAMLFVTLFAQYGLGGYLTSVENWSGNLAFHVQVALSIAMGLGIDYGIYMLSRLREEMRASGGDWAESLRQTLNTTGSAVLIFVVVLLGSFIPLMNTHLANTWSVSLYISVALVIDVIAALTLLPLMVRWMRPRYVFGATGSTSRD